MPCLDLRRCSCVIHRLVLHPLPFLSLLLGTEVIVKSLFFHHLTLKKEKPKKKTKLQFTKVRITLWLTLLILF